jgi:hypothetical protein
MRIARQMMIETIENGWDIGCGPAGLPYAAFRDEDFGFS